MTPKHRRIEGNGGTWTRPLTPALTPSQRAARHAEIERGLAEAQKLARLASIQEALSAVQTRRSSEDTVFSGTPSSNSAHYPAQDSPSEYSRLAIIEAALQDSRQQRSDVPPSPSSASRNQALPMALPRPPPPSQSDAGYSISSEIEEADLEDMEDKAIQTDPCDDEESVIADFLNSSPTASVLGLPVVYPTSLGSRSASARIGSGPSRASVSRMPDSEHGSESWMPASPGPLLTPERGRSTRARMSGGNVGGGMLLTPPGTSQTDWQPAIQDEHGPYSRQYGADAAAPQSPTLRTKGKGRELPRCASASTSLSGGSQWQMVQDDDLENPFHDRATAPGSPESPTSSISGADSFGSGLFSRPLSADVIESQIAMLANIPEYVRKLERRERAALSSADIKSRRIAQLEEEVQRTLGVPQAEERQAGVGGNHFSTASA
ncbi:hypothetical protein C8Q74DRAFT_1367885 [Fomes fomentarius]|nr:hypothetical protein C8Q74DRAFT_1367885 [Fomes fomentarius]